jgi:hypothetical protein
MTSDVMADQQFTFPTLIDEEVIVDPGSSEGES